MTAKTHARRPVRHTAILCLLLGMSIVPVLPVQAQHPDSLPSIVLPPTDGSTLQPATMQYQILMNMMGQEMKMEGTRTISAAYYEDRPVWRLVDTGNSDWGPYTDSIEVDRQTLLPVRRRSVGSSNTTLLYTEDAVTGEIAMGSNTMPVNVSLEAPVFGSESSLELAIAGMTLAEGDTMLLRSFYPYTQQVRTMKLSVTGTETTEVPAGAFETLVVELAPLDGDGSERWVLRMMPQTPHYLVQGHYHLPKSIGGGLIVVTLLSQGAEAQ